MNVILPYVAHVPLLGYNLLSLKRMADRQIRRREKWSGIAPENGKTLFGLSKGRLSYLSGFRRPLDSSDFALATIAPGKIPPVTPVDINTFHMPHGHVYEKLLCSTTKLLRVVLEGSFGEYEGCSVAKGLGKPIGRTTLTRADKVFGRLFVDSGETSVASIEGEE